MDKPILHVYFDMDGVLVRFDEQDSVTKPFLVPGSHYFRHQPADTKAVDLMRALDEFRAIKTHVLTRLLPGLDKDIMDEHEADKLAWCQDISLTAGFGHGREAPFACLRGTHDKNLPLIGIQPRSARNRHVLIDDDPQILTAWEKEGGVGFQYVQYGRTAIRRHHRNVIHWDTPVAELAAIVMAAPYDPGPLR